MEQLKNLRDGSKGVEVQGEIIAIGDIRQVNTRGGAKEVADATLRDETGTIKLSLWEDEIKSVNLGSTVHIRNGYVTTFRGERQLSIGKFGTMEVQLAMS